VTGAGNRNFAIYSATRVNAVETEDPDAFTVKTIEIGLPIP
jgi:hypothetical protein